MTLSLLAEWVVGLCSVVGLFLLLAYLARRLYPWAQGGQERRLAVLSRVNLSSRQGMAVVRAGDRAFVVSYGEGGVRLLMRLPDDEEDESARLLGAGTRDGAAGVPRGPSRSLRALLALMVTLSALAVSSGGAAGQIPSGQASPPVAAGPDLTPGAAEALQRVIPRLNLQVGDEEGGLKVSGTVGAVLLMGAMTLIPTMLLLMTSFTRILIVLHLLKQALGTQTAPPGHLLSALALLLTGFIMAPTLSDVNRTAIVPWMDGQTDEVAMLQSAVAPFRTFMLQSTREQDLRQFLEMSRNPMPSTVEEIPTVVLTSAFVTSELTSAFQMGFALFLPFLVIDLVVASVLMSMGMFMLPPVMVSLPFKLLLFVMVDGWSLVVSSLVQSF